MYLSIFYIVFRDFSSAVPYPPLNWLKSMMNKLLELDTKKIKRMIYGKSAEIADKVGMRKGLLSKKVNGHTIITL